MELGDGLADVGVGRDAHLYGQVEQQAGGMQRRRVGRVGGGDDDVVVLQPERQQAGLFHPAGAGVADRLGRPLVRFDQGERQGAGQRFGDGVFRRQP